MIKKTVLMSMVLLAVIFTLGATSSYAKENEDISDTGKVIVDVLNVRTGPSVEYDKIGILEKDMEVTILDSCNGWYKIELEEGEEGWSSGRYILSENDYIGKVTASKLNIRTGPSVEDDIDNQLHKNQTVTIIESEDGWHKLKFDNDEEGWANGNYITTDPELITKIEPVVNISNNTVSTTSSSNASRSNSTVSTTSSSNASSSNIVGNNIKVEATAYTGPGITSTGQTPQWGTIAVDPKVIPYGTKVYIPYFDKVFVANDTGGAIKGNKIDIYMNSSQDCYNWGRKTIDIQILQ